MFTAPQADASQTKAELYSSLETQLTGLLAGETDEVANMANTAALLFHSLPEINWAGFYLLKEDELVLGPFQGRPACVRIPLGRGVCGTAARDRTMLRVADVNEFPGHIACDAASRSEIVMPLVNADGALLGVLDIDSPIPDRFDHDDEAGIEKLAAILMRQMG